MTFGLASRWNERHLVLAGAGHAHLEVLHRLARRPLPGTRVTIVTPEPETAYSGMLPGVLAGHYRLRDLMIPVAPLAARAGAALVVDAVVELDPEGRWLRLASSKLMGFDLLSLDVGAVPAADGAASGGLAVKPIGAFVPAWEAAEARLRPGARVAVVGGGVSGVEVALALAHRMARQGREAAVELVEKGPQIVPGLPAAARRRLERLCAQRALAVRVGVEEAPESAAVVVWAAGVTAPDWIAAAGLATDARGFAAVDPTLRSRSHPWVFAAGDVATTVENPRPKAGVFAVRQGPVLADNLARALAGRPLRRFWPQRAWLTLIATGPRHAVATRNGLTLSGRWAWRWKDWIDRRYVARYRA